MAATATRLLAQETGVREVEVIKEVKVTETIYRTNTIQVPVTSNAPSKPVRCKLVLISFRLNAERLWYNRTAASQLAYP